MSHFGHFISKKHPQHVDQNRQALAQSLKVPVPVIHPFSTNAQKQSTIKFPGGEKTPNAKRDGDAFDTDAESLEDTVSLHIASNQDVRGGAMEGSKDRKTYLTMANPAVRVSSPSPSDERTPSVERDEFDGDLDAGILNDVSFREIVGGQLESQGFVNFVKAYFPEEEGGQVRNMTIRKSLPKSESFQQVLTDARRQQEQDRQMENTEEKRREISVEFRHHRPAVGSTKPAADVVRPIVHKHVLGVFPELKPLEGPVIIASLSTKEAETRKNIFGRTTIPFVKPKSSEELESQRGFIKAELAGASIELSSDDEATPPKSGPQDSNTVADPATPHKVKRKLSLDYSLKDLSTMTFKQLQEESFTGNTIPTSTTIITTTKSKSQDSLQTELERLLGIDSTRQRSSSTKSFLNSLDLEAFNLIGEIITTNLANIVTDLRDIRHEKRTIALQLEQEIAHQEFLVQRDREVVEKQFEDLRQSGQNVVGRGGNVGSG